MSIFSQPAPALALEALEADIGTFMEEPPSLAKDALAFPIFVVDQKGEFDVERLNTYDQPDAWRFVLMGKSGHMAIGEVTRQRVSYELSFVSQDATRANELLDLVDQARNATDASNDFELRLFEAPAFHIHAVWLRGCSEHGQDLFLIIGDGKDRRAEVLMNVEQFAGVFNRAREDKLGLRGLVNYSSDEVRREP